MYPHVEFHGFRWVQQLIWCFTQYVSLAGITLAGGSRKMSGYSPIFTTNSEQPPEQLMDCKIDHCRSLTHKKCHHGTGRVQSEAVILIPQWHPLTFCGVVSPGSRTSLTSWRISVHPVDRPSRSKKNGKKKMATCLNTSLERVSFQRWIDLEGLPAMIDRWSKTFQILS